ncbi:MAG: aminoglycoside phosphotransferase family protein [Firmicutes bacterium]|nr:aminoglycoside phosphotransferase family protein [[Eubacterium] siraeum]MCM1488585.1 aminoglycoside phosphotransferase family protein [Bacillota bacterium]
MTANGVSQEEMTKLSTIEGYGKWKTLDGYDPDKRYIPDSNKLKTGVICLPPIKKKAKSPTLKIYAVTTEDGKNLLIRTDRISRFEEECKLAALTDRVFNEAGVYTSSPLEVGAFDDDAMVYSMYNFFSGENLASRLPEFYVPEQLALGVEAGKQLKKLQTLTPTEDDEVKPAEDIFALIARLAEKGIKYQGFGQAAEFLKKRSNITEQRPVTALHGDFSANTLFLDSDLNVGMAPLQSVAWGDPITDLVTLPDGYSLPFIKGVYKGFFDGAPPKDFFELLAIYSTVKALKDIDEAQTEEDSAAAIIRAQKTAAEYDGYQSVIPSWY